MLNKEEAVEYIESVPWSTLDVGMKRMKGLLECLGSPEKRLTFIHVAGTNGKGSVCSMLSSVFIAAGFRTGLFTSPHLLEMNERIRVNGVNIGDSDFCRITDEVKTAEQEMAEGPSEYEKLTAIGMKYFAEQNTDIVIMEVGLGGEFDSTNVIEKPLVSVITAIGFDHMALLGDTLPKIASAKAGIIKPSCPVVVYPAEEAVIDVFREAAEKCGSKLSVCDFSDFDLTGNCGSGRTFRFKGFEGELELALKGEYQKNNVSLVLTVLRELRESAPAHISGKLSDENIRKGLRAASWPARFELVAEGPDFYVDGAHNPQGIDAAVSSLKALFSERSEKGLPEVKAVVILGILADKDVDDMIGRLSPVAERFITLTPPNPRAMDAAELAERIKAAGGEAECAESVMDAVRLARAYAGKDGIVCSLGSLYLAGHIRKAAEEE